MCVCVGAVAGWGVGGVNEMHTSRMIALYHSKASALSAPNVYVLRDKSVASEDTHRRLKPRPLPPSYVLTAILLSLAVQSSVSEGAK